jgi:hypothetical protein
MAEQTEQKIERRVDVHGPLPTSPTNRDLHGSPIFPDDDTQPTIRRVTRDSATGKVITDTGDQPAATHPISQEEFNAKAKGGHVHEKSWQRALAQEQKRRAAPQPSPGPRPRGSW